LKESQERASQNCCDRKFEIETGEHLLMKMIEMWNEVWQMHVVTDAGQWAGYQQAGESVEEKIRSWTWWDGIV
jgi:hypothetical protein